MSKWVSFRVSAYCDNILLRLDSEALRLYDKWRVSDSDEDFEELVDWVRDDIASELDFEIEDATER